MHTLSSSTRILNIRFISAVLRFERGFRITDAGMYTCIVQGNVTSQSGVITLEQTETAVTTERMECKLNSATAYFQIRVLSTSCSLWDASTLRVTEANLVDAVTVSITSQCRDCDPGSAEIVITNRTACIKGAALFKGRITSSPAQTKLLFCELQEWQRTGPIIHLTNDRTLLFQVDRACTVKSESLTSSKCSMDSSNSSTLLAFSSGAVLFLVIVIISSIAGMVGTQIHRRYVLGTYTHALEEPSLIFEALIGYLIWRDPRACTFTFLGCQFVVTAYPSLIHQSPLACRNCISLGANDLQC